MNKLRFVFNCILILWCFIACTSEKKQTQNLGTQAIRDYQEQVEQKIIELEKASQNLVLGDQGVYWGNDSLDFVMLSEFVKEQKMYFYFSYNTCSPCVQECVNMLERYMPDYLENENIVFLSPDYLPRFRENCYGKRLLGLRNEELGIPLEKEEVPFFFTLDKDLTIKNLHVVNKNDFKRTGAYLKKMRN